MPTTNGRAAGRGQLWLGLLVLYIVWGSTYLGIAVAVETIPPFLMAASRFALAGLVLLTWSVVRARGSFVMPTLHEWRDAFNANWDSINAQGFDETFRRMWEFYLAYCEAGFSVGYIDVFQIQIQRAQTQCPQEA